jgi:hypothetical protein
MMVAGESTKEVCPVMLRVFAVLEAVEPWWVTVLGRSLVLRGTLALCLCLTTERWEIVWREIACLS